MNEYSKRERDSQLLINYVIPYLDKNSIKSFKKIIINEFYFTMNFFLSICLPFEFSYQGNASDPGEKKFKLIGLWENILTGQSIQNNH